MKKYSFLLLLIVSSYIAFSQTPQDYTEELLQNTEKLSQKETKNKYIKAAQVKETIGYLTEAAELYKKASLVVSGKKDFLALYKAAVLNTEMAFYEQAKTDVKAILLFSDDKNLRIKATILESKINLLTGNYKNAFNTMGSIIKSGDNLPEEFFTLAVQILEKAKQLNYNTKDFAKRYEILEIKNQIPKTTTIKPLKMPETIFNNTQTIKPNNKTTETPTTKPTPEKNNDNTIASGIQVGSFSVKDNANELKNALQKENFKVSITEKTINKKKYFSVIVEVDKKENLQNIMIGLKEKGYEGYPIY